MSIVHVLEFIDPKLIVIDREDRQRQQNMDIDDLIVSIRARGILTPIILDEDNKLVAGERRTRTALFLELPSVPIFRWENLTEIERQIVELEENVKRKDLTWQDQARAIRRIHNLYMALEDSDHSIEQTAMLLGMHERHIYKMLEVGEALNEGDPSVIKADTIAQAQTILIRRKARTTADALNKITEMASVRPKLAQDSDRVADATRVSGASASSLAAVGEGEGSVVDGGDHRSLPDEPVIPYAIVHGDAHEFLGSYTGQKFNFLHCDLPYGVALNGQANQGAFEGGGYDSDPDIYWALCRSLVEHWDNFMYPSSHIMFWISMKFYSETVSFFEKHLAHKNIRVNPTPLIWHKTDNKGIISDALRGPRNVYEACLLMSTGDRKIVKPISNVYGCPAGQKEIHTNEKPEPMLRHFMSMLVDGQSRVLDPTAGSGAAIRVAESLNSEAALGLEFNAEFAERAQAKLIRTRQLSKLSSQVSAAAFAASLAPDNSSLDSDEKVS